MSQFSKPSKNKRRDLEKSAIKGTALRPMIAPRPKPDPNTRGTRTVEKVARVAIPNRKGGGGNVTII